MKLNVPFVKSLKKNKGKGWCRPIALASILRYYKKKYKLEDVVNKAGTNKKVGGTSPNGLIYYCLSKGMKVIHLSKKECMKY